MPNATLAVLDDAIAARPAMGDAMASRERLRSGRNRARGVANRLLATFLASAFAVATAATPDASVEQAIGTLVAAFPVERSYGTGDGRPWLATLYANPVPVWFTGAATPRPAIEVALRALSNAADRGLDPADYDIASLEAALRAAAAPGASPHAIAAADVALSTSMLRFLSDLRFGRVSPGVVEPHYRPPEKDARFVLALRGAVASGRLVEAIVDVEPAFVQYARLSRLLARYRALAAHADRWEALDLPRAKVVAGEPYPLAASLRERLALLGDLPTTATTDPMDTYTPALSEGVRRFQRRHGLADDGVLGAGTIAALNVHPHTRAAQVALSMERLRWIPAIAPGPLIVVNIPSFQLWAFADATRDASPALASPVVVGRAARSQTPVFQGEMRRVEFSPYWNVPTRIARNEYVGRLARDPALLVREDMEIVASRGPGDGAHAVDAETLRAVAGGTLRLRQRPGPKNALGGVKFVLPNTMDVYLHGTPARALFERTRRDFSHGCIRVRDAPALAHFVLRDQAAWTPAAIEAAMRAGTPVAAPLASPVPVIVFYTTALVDGEGRAHFLPDVYGHDAKLEEAIRRARGRASGDATSPAPHAAGVDVHELGLRIEADAARLQR